jgi:hypothetical protein
VVMLLEEGNAYRQIYTLPKDPQPSWFGYSIGKREGDTLVVETNGLNDKAILDGAGHPRGANRCRSQSVTGASILAKWK